ncbi:MAG: penicillin-binding protein 1C [Phormidesmis sp.]
MMIRRLYRYLYKDLRCRFWPRLLLGLLAFSLLVRLSPYLVPIRAVDIAQDQLAVEFSDRHGLPLGTILTRDQEHTAVVPLAQVSPSFIQAILSAEDQRFYQHGPLDLRAVGRSLLEAAQAREIVSGASTITMQLARMLEPAPRTLRHKANEVWLSWRLAAGMSRDEILAAYINRLPMGSNIYGVEAAAQVYFGIPAAELNLAQSSLLAALPNDPVDLDPYFHWEALKQRQGYVLNRMVADSALSPQHAQRVAAERVTVRQRSQGIQAAPHFLFWLAAQLPETHPAHLQTTLDLPLQNFVQAQVQQIVQSLATKQVNQAAALVIDNKTGEVLAYVGSPDYFGQGSQGRNDGVQALRQPGSTLKPFLYQLALETRTIKPNSILADVPTRYPIPGAKVYSPVDYSERFHGPVRVRAALANSLNIPAVKVLEKVGVPAFLERLHELGFVHLNESADYYGLGLALGSGEVNLWELARAYVTLARGGDPIELSTFKAGALSPIDSEEQTAGILPSPIWNLVRDMLSDPYARSLSFGVDSVLNLPFAAAVKTGTSSDFRDTWTVGFTSDYTVATWAGNFSGEPMRQISGVMGAAPLWQRILLHLHEQQEPQNFPPLTEWEKRSICAISGRKPTADCRATVEEYFAPNDLAEYARSADTPFRLSPEYDEWLASQPEEILTAGELRILTPREDAYFVAVEAARLAFKIVAPVGEAVEWRLNGRPLETMAKREFFWTMEPGDWVLEVKSGELSDRVRFQVRSPSGATERQGFSVVRPGES